MKLSVVPSGFYPEAATAEAIERVAAAGADAVELLDFGELGPGEAADLAADHGIEVALAQASGDTVGIDNTTPALADPDSVEQSIRELEASVETAVAAEAPNLLVVVGQRQPTRPRHEQHLALVEVFREVAPEAEDAGVTIVPEVLNTISDHPGYYLSDPGEAVEIAAAVDSPAVGFLLDIYHQQVQHGNVIETLTGDLEHLGHVHFADVPDRTEPGTGELAMGRVLEALDEADYEGYVGAELGSTVGDPDEALREIVELVP